MHPSRLRLSIRQSYSSVSVNDYDYTSTNEFEACLRMYIITSADINAHQEVLRLARYIHRQLHASGKVTSIYPTVREHLYRSSGHLFRTCRQERRRIETERKEKTYVSGYVMQEALEAMGTMVGDFTRVKMETVDQFGCGTPCAIMCD